jgi:Vps16, N-terminal region
MKDNSPTQLADAFRINKLVDSRFYQ